MTLVLSRCLPRIASTVVWSMPAVQAKARPVGIRTRTWFVRPGHFVVAWSLWWSLAVPACGATVVTAVLWWEAVVGDSVSEVVMAK